MPRVCREGVALVIDAPALRQTANQLGQIAAMVTEQAFAAGQDLSALAKDLATLKASADLCRAKARKVEARAAQEDDAAPLCLGCQHRVDANGGGLVCALAMDTKEASAKRRCAQYKPE